MQTEAYRASRSARKKIETLFGEAKHIHSLVRLRLRGLSGARDEFLLTATVQDAAVERGFAAGADDYIKKPFSPTALADRIANALRGR